MGVRVDHDEAVRSSQPMISTSWRPDTRRFVIAGLLLSVLLHFGGGVLWALFQQTPIVKRMSGLPPVEREKKPEITELITIERAPPPKVRPHVAPPPPAHFVELKPVAHALEPRPIVRPPTELVHIVAHAPRSQPVEHGGGRPENVPQPHAQAVERPSPQHDRSHLTSEQIAKLESQFSQTIASTREDVSATVSQVQEPVTGQRHLIADGLTPGQGYMRSIDFERIDRSHIKHYVHYTYMYPDGHIEEDDIPWPFIFSIRDDPFLDRRQPVMHMQLPPPGFRPTRQLTPIEQEAYTAAQGQPPPAASP
jgi:hypothetical protein